MCQVPTKLFSSQENAMCPAVKVISAFAANKTNNSREGGTVTIARNVIWRMKQNITFFPLFRILDKKISGRRKFIFHIEKICLISITKDYV